jgi:iron complex transport system permease protein
MKEGKRRKPSDRIGSSQEPTGEAITLIEGVENPYAKEVDKGHKVDPRAQKIFICGVVLVILFIAGLILPRDIAGVNNLAGYDLSYWAEDLRERFLMLVTALTILGGEATPSAWVDAAIVLNTSEQFLVVIFAGAGLGLTGAVYQSTLRNALAAPSTLGIMTGATFGAVMWVVLFYSNTLAGRYTQYSYSATDPTRITVWENGSQHVIIYEPGPLRLFWDNWGVAVCSFIGCVVVAGIILLIVRVSGRQKVSNIALIIIGSVISATFGAVMEAIRYYYTVTDPWGAKTEMLKTVQSASFYRDFGILDIVSISIPLLAVLLLILYLRPRLMLLTFNEDEARSMGTDTRRIKLVMIALTTLLVAIIVSFCGVVGFLGFLVPHLTRRVVGPTLSYLLPASAVVGAIFLMGAWDLLLIINSAYSTAVGMYISLFGAVIFLITALRQRGGDTRGDWRI